MDQVQGVSGVTALCSSPPLQSADGAHCSLWGPHSEGMEEGAVWAVEATGVENVRQALVCLRGTADTISDWCQNCQSYLLGGGLCIYACWCFYKCRFRGQGSLCVYISVKLSVLIRILESGCYLYHQELLCQQTHLYDTLQPPLPASIWDPKGIKPFSTLSLHS